MSLVFINRKLQPPQKIQVIKFMCECDGNKNLSILQARQKKGSTFGA